jgi:hypothetical protein
MNSAAATPLPPPDLFGGSLPARAAGWSVNKLATELRLDRRTVTARLADVAPVGEGSSGPVYALADAARALFGGGEGGGGRKIDALKERLLAAQAESAELDLAAKRGDLVSANDVRAAAMDNARIEREALLLWPARVAAVLSAEFGADMAALTTALEREIRTYMEERADDDAGLRALP